MIIRTRYEGEAYGVRAATALPATVSEIPNRGGWRDLKSYRAHNKDAARIPNGVRKLTRLSCGIVRIQEIEIS